MPQAQKDVRLSEPEDSFIPLNVEPKTPISGLLPKAPPGRLDDQVFGSLLQNLRPFISGATGAAGSVFGGPVGGIAGYIVPDVAMKAIDPTHPPYKNAEDWAEPLTDSAKEGLINEIGGKIFEGVFGGLKAVRNAANPDPMSILKLYPKSSQALTHFGYSKLGSLSKFLEDFGAPEASAAALDKSGGEGFTQALLLSNRMNSGGKFTKNVFQDPAVLKQKIMDTLEKGINKNATPGQFQTPTHYVSKEAFDMFNQAQHPFQVIDDVINDKNKLSKVLSVGQLTGPKSLNVRKDLQAYYWNRIFDEATTTLPGGGARIDPDVINKQWFNPKSGELAKNLETLYGKNMKGDLDKFMKNVIETQNNPMNFSGLGGKLKYLPGGFALGGLIQGLTGSAAATSALMSGLYVSTKTMGRLLTNPSVGKGLIDFLNGAPLSTGNKLLARGVFNALAGTRVAMMDNQNKKTWGQIERQPDGSYMFKGD